ncbi:MAG: RNA-binding protein [Elusimicrobia bacterium]|nr:RNA-binding protein [Candidatus Obscuribacterium magneticum]
MTKLFVGSLPFETTEGDLQQMFVPSARGQRKLITERETGRSRGFGFVEVADDAHAQAAIQKLHDSSVGSRKIVVNVAKPMEPRSGGFGGGRDRGGNSGRW